jgi:hypothetical protein
MAAVEAALAGSDYWQPAVWQSSADPVCHEHGNGTPEVAFEVSVAAAVGGAVGEHFDRNPFGKPRRHRAMRSGRRVLLSLAIESRRSNPFGQANQGGPYAPMRVGDLRVHETAPEDVGTIVDSAQNIVNASGLRMSPAAAPHWGPCDRVDDVRELSFGSFEHDPMTLDEGDGSLGSHGNGHRERWMAKAYHLGARTSTASPNSGNHCGPSTGNAAL